MRRHPARVRHYPAGRLRPPARAARSRLRHRPCRGSPSPLLGQPGRAARCRRLARPLPPLLDAAPPRPRDRAGPRQTRATAAPADPRKEHPKPMIDVIHEINAMRRQVGTRVLEAGRARTLTVARTYDAEVQDVWDACTNPERIRRWFLP